MEEAKDLSEKFKIVSYNGINKESSVENIFKPYFEHESTNGNNFVLITKFQSETNSNGFELTNFLIYSYDYEEAPIKSG